MPTPITYDSFFTDLGAGAINPTSDTFYMMLTTSSYTPSKGTHAKRSAITNEVVGTGYTAGGQAVVCTPATNTTTHVWTLTPATTVWSGATLTARYGVIYKHRGGLASADELVCLVDFGADITSTAAAFTVTFSAPLTITN
jgi:hypothetical protein